MMCEILNCSVLSFKTPFDIAAFRSPLSAKSFLCFYLRSGSFMPRAISCLFHLPEGSRAQSFPPSPACSFSHPPLLTAIPSFPSNTRSCKSLLPHICTWVFGCAQHCIPGMEAFAVPFSSGLDEVHKADTQQLMDLRSSLCFLLLRGIAEARCSWEVCPCT